MRRPSRPLLFTALVLALGCDTKSDDELRAMMGDVAAGHVDAVREKQTALDEAQTAQAETITGLTEKVAQLEGKLAAAETRLATLEAEPPPPPTPPSPTPTPLAGRPDPAATYKVPVSDAQTKGSDTALVTIVIWSDFQCPYCQRVNATLKEIERDYGSDVRFAFKHNPLGFHPRALPAAIAAEAAGAQGKFWEMHDLLFENNKDLTDTNFVAWAKDLKLDVKAFEAALGDKAIERRIKDHQSEGTTLGARGTPAFFINGRFLSGAQPYASFKTLIDAELKEAEALVAAGTARSAVYDKVISSGKTSV